MTTDPDGVGGGEDGTLSWRRLAAETEERLRRAGVPSPAVDARRIVEEASGHEGAEYAVHLDEPATVRGVAHLDDMVGRRAAGEPLQYVLGRWGFRTLDLLVDRRVLIPRPETEVVAGLAVAEARRVADTGRAPTVVDLGTGSGAIALSIAVEVREAQVWGVDRSPDALAVARANLAGTGRAGARVNLLTGSWFEPLPAELRGTVDVVVANPPYVASSDELPAEVADWEPAGALTAGPTGLEDLSHIVAGAPAWLALGGALVVELAPHQARAVAGLARDTGFVDVTVHDDLAGRARAVVARR